MIFDSWNPPWHGLIALVVGGLVVYIIARVVIIARAQQKRPYDQELDRCPVPCSDAAGTCDTRCPHLEEPLDAAAGVVGGVLLGLLLWAIIAGVVYLIIHLT